MPVSIDGEELSQGILLSEVIDYLGPEYDYLGEEERPFIYVSGDEFYRKLLSPYMKKMGLDELIILVNT